jgi:hypothetical protein
LRDRLFERDINKRAAFRARTNARARAQKFCFFISGFFLFHFKDALFKHAGCARNATVFIVVGAEKHITVTAFKAVRETARRWFWCWSASSSSSSSFSQRGEKVSLSKTTDTNDTVGGDG